MHAAPTPTGSFFKKLGQVVRYLLKLEPVVVAAVWRALVVLLTAAGVTINTQLDGRVVAVIGAFYALVELISTIVARQRSTGWAGVVEQADFKRHIVVAGPANEREATGTVVRDLVVPDRPLA